jgi:hypothetical protein
MSSRRAVIAAGAAVAIGALGYRAWDRGVLSADSGPAYAPWNEWRGSDTDGRSGRFAQPFLPPARTTPSPGCFDCPTVRLRSMPIAPAISERSIRSAGRCILGWAAPSRIWCGPRVPVEWPPTCSQSLAASSSHLRRRPSSSHGLASPSGVRNKRCSSKPFPDDTRIAAHIATTYLRLSSCEGWLILPLDHGFALRSWKTLVLAANWGR